MRTQDIISLLRPAYPEARSELTVWNNPFQFAVCVMLSAQSTDIAVNKLAPELFTKYPGVAEFAVADVLELENSIRHVGLANFKAKNIKACAQQLLDKHAGVLPDNLKELIALPGIGRKSANVILDTIFNKAEGIVVDTHVLRLSVRMGLTDKTKPYPVERALMTLTSPDQWGVLGHMLTWHGRRRCFAVNPDCDACELKELCPKIGAERTAKLDPPRLYGAGAGEAKQGD